MNVDHPHCCYVFNGCMYPAHCTGERCLGRASKEIRENPELADPPPVPEDRHSPFLAEGQEENNPMLEFIRRLRAAASLLAQGGPARTSLEECADEFERSLKEMIEGPLSIRTQDALSRVNGLWARGKELHLKHCGRVMVSGPAGQGKRGRT